METASHSPNHWRSLLIGESPAMRRLRDLIQIIAHRRSTVLITGETGTGKEVVAHAIHRASPRMERALIAVNCAAIPRELLEVELFGCDSAIFAGSAMARIGRFEQADRGTLLLDEIGDMSLDLQSKLLRVLQDREFQRVGGSNTVKIDARVLASTNIDLGARVKQGKFREDLYYRLHVLPIHIPPLRERRQDIPLLTEYFLKKIGAAEGLPLKSVHPEAVNALMRYLWPGNVRQLENTIEMAMVLSGDRPELVTSDFALPADGSTVAVEISEDQLIKLPEEGLDFEAVIGRIELNLLEQAMQRARGNKKAAADILRLKRTTLAAKLKSLESAFTAMPADESEAPPD
jgi:transcriptional regulator with GAF, ATPase, and Fis domain